MINGLSLQTSSDARLKTYKMPNIHNDQYARRMDLNRAIRFAVMGLSLNNIPIYFCSVSTFSVFSPFASSNSLLVHANCERLTTPRMMNNTALAMRMYFGLM